MRRAARKDANHRAIVEALEAVGCSVLDTSRLGDDAPDLMVARHRVTIAFEIKDGAKPPSRRRLRPGQQAWHETWRGLAFTVLNVEHALALVNTHASVWSR